ncbi:hypothetical protein HPB52_005308 [Rhipicephalus sanguineus]|uniref:Uncharacterized protein n=1 Tax=Rhipicephalus sanguineus TaxID=34632 RepID=A0A9D4PUC0_RHISA|nr:hypothetical protein HPB52_005308 [Rhipicephalus sanguineus]
MAAQCSATQEARRSITQHAYDVGDTLRGMHAESQRVKDWTVSSGQVCQPANPHERMNLPDDFSLARAGLPVGSAADLIKRLTSYYGLALRSNTDVEDMKKAVMATFHNVSSTDAEPHHELCPSGARSWCRHRAAEAEGKPQLPHTYNLPNKVVEALRPVYQRLFDPQLQARCSGNKTQNAAESLHSVIWSLISKQQHASHFTVEVAVHEAVERKLTNATLAPLPPPCHATGGERVSKCVAFAGAVITPRCMNGGLRNFGTMDSTKQTTRSA